METTSQQAANLRTSWETDQRWAGVRRDYSAADAIRLRASVVEEHTQAIAPGAETVALAGSTEQAQFSGWTDYSFVPMD